MLNRLKRYAEAEQLISDTLERQRTLLGEDHSDTLESMYVCGYVIRERGRLVEAEALTERTFKARSGVLGPEHRSTKRPQGTHIQRGRRPDLDSSAGFERGCLLR